MALPCKNSWWPLFRRDCYQLCEDRRLPPLPFCGIEIKDGIDGVPRKRRGSCPCTLGTLEVLVEVAGAELASAATAGPLVVPTEVPLPSQPEEENSGEASAPPAMAITPVVSPTHQLSASRLAARVMAENLTTLQCHGLDRYAVLEHLVLLLNSNGMQGRYNFVSIPRNIAGEGLGYAFINFTSPETAAMLLSLWEGSQCHPSVFVRCARFKIASKQGYHSYVSTKSISSFERLRNVYLWPLVMTEDGEEVVFGSSACVQAACAA
mmetsp:Transcript_66058/g.123215  ORF Transcript_66058/g.123215 Transcript_66058/m.123215 type:complete len:265 (-) Transcript_66058:110-904(-)